MHVKAHPTYVSDTTVPDVHGFWRLLDAHGGAAESLSARLVTAFNAGRLRIFPDYFWCGGAFLPQMPDYLRETFQGAALVIIKGDLNYRRAVSDGLWAAGTHFDDVMAYMPAPFLALRTFKSDPNVGLSAAQMATLDAQDAAWRVNGKRGVIQFKR
jgi:hypothetical protein